MKVFCSGLAVHRAHGYRRDSPGCPAEHPAGTVRSSPGHPSATTLLQEPARDFSSLHGFALGSKAIELARQKQDIQEPRRGTACTHRWVFREDRLKSVSCQQRVCTAIPFLQETEGQLSLAVTISYCTASKECQGRAHKAPVCTRTRHEGGGPQPAPDMGGSVWETLPRACLGRPLAQHLLVPHHAASPHNAFAPQRDQKASNPLIARVCVERLPDYLTISCTH